MNKQLGDDATALARGRGSIVVDASPLPIKQ